MLKISDQIATYVTELFPDEKADNKIKRLLENEFRRRLTQYQYTVRNLETKYKMNFETFKAKNIVAKKGYSFETETDFCDWEMALDGITTIERKLRDMKSYNNDDR